MEADQGAKHAGEHRHYRRHHQHAFEAAAQHKGDDARGDQHGDHQDHPHGLQRGDDGHRQQAQQPVVQQLDRQANHPRMMRIEAVQHEVFALEQHHRQGDAGDQQGLLQLAVGNAQHVAEQNVAQVLVGIDA